LAPVRVRSRRRTQCFSHHPETTQHSDFSKIPLCQRHALGHRVGLREKRFPKQVGGQIMVRPLPVVEGPASPSRATDLREKSDDILLSLSFQRRAESNMRRNRAVRCFRVEVREVQAELRLV
jgi:hypothetical protein